jgi:NADH:ubiquinone oxidoreductase subunit E
MNVTVCIGSSCHLKGSREIIQMMQKLIKDHNLDGKVELNGSFCMGNCMNGVSVKVDEELFSLSPDKTEEFFQKEVMGRL